MLAWTLLAVVVIVVVLLVLVLRRSYKPYAAPPPDETAAAQAYTVPSPWLPATPSEGLDGKCNLYTFPARERYSPAVMTYSTIQTCAANACLPGTTCTCTPDDVSLSGCLDDDQLYAQQLNRNCGQNPIDSQLRNRGYCRRWDGTFATPGQIETYYQACGGLSRCLGSIGLVAFNATIPTPGPAALDSALCLAAATAVAPIAGQRCDMRQATQLYRIQRADFDGNAFTPSTQGRFARLIYRPTNTAISPALQGNSLLLPVPGQPLQLTPITAGSDGYWWYLAPALKSPTGVTPARVSRSQLVFINKPLELPPPDDTKALWTYLTAAGRLIAIPASTTPGSAVITREYVTVDPTVADQSLSVLAQPLLINYSLANLITTRVSNFDFYGPFQ